MLNLVIFPQQIMDIGPEDAPEPWLCTIMYHGYVPLIPNYIDGSMQDCGISIANALEIQQPFTKPSI